MKLYGKCEACRKKKWFVSKRTFSHKIAGEIVSKAEICKTCYKNISKMIS